MWVVNVSKEMFLLFSAFDLALALTELDEVCELVTDARYAYGKTGKYVYISLILFYVF